MSRYNHNYGESNIPSESYRVRSSYRSSKRPNKKKINRELGDALRQGKSEKVIRLLKQGASPRGSDLRYGIEYCDISVVKALFNREEFSVRKDNISAAIKINSADKLTFLLKKAKKQFGKNYQDAIDPSKLLVLACHQSKEEIAVVLLQSGGASSNCTHKKGKLVIDLVLEKNNFRMAIILIEAGADLNRCRIQNLDKLFRYAIGNNLSEIFNLIVETGRINLNRANKSKQTPLRLAIQQNKEDLVVRLLEEGAQIGTSSIQEKETLLVIAAYYGFDNTINELVGKKINVNKNGGYYDHPPLYHAIDNNQIQTVVLLLRLKAKVTDEMIDLIIRENKTNAMRTMFNSTRQNISISIDQFCVAVELSHIDLINCFFTQGIAPDINLGNSDDRRPLEIALEKKDFNLVILLLQHQANIDLVGGKSHFFRCAIDSLNQEMLTYLLNQATNMEELIGVDYSPIHALLEDGTKQGSIPSYRAASRFKHDEEKKKALVKLLLDKGIDGNVYDHQGQTVMAAAINAGYFSIAGCLIAAGVSINKANLSDAKTPLHLSVEKNNLELTATLMAHGAYLNSEDDYGNAPLHTAIQNGIKFEIIELLISNESIDIHQQNKLCETALHLAAHFRKLDVLKMLLSKGWEVNSPDHEGNSPLLRAVMRTNTYRVDIEAELLAHHADVNVKNQTAGVPLTYALEKNNIRLISLFLQSGADISLLPDGVSGLLSFAVHHSNPELLGSLFENGVDVNEIIESDKNALCLAIEEENILLSEYLLQKGGCINVRIPESLGKNLLTSAISLKKPFLMAFCLEKEVEIGINTANTLFKLSVELGYERVLFLLLERGFILTDIIEPQTKRLNTSAYQKRQARYYYTSHASATTNSRKSPLLIAAEKGHHNILKLLIRYERKPKRGMIRWIVLGESSPNYCDYHLVNCYKRALQQQSFQPTYNNSYWTGFHALLQSRSLTVPIIVSLKGAYNEVSQEFTRERELIKVKHLANLLFQGSRCKESPIPKDFPAELFTLIIFYTEIDDSFVFSNMNQGINNRRYTNRTNAAESTHIDPPLSFKDIDNMVLFAEPKLNRYYEEAKQHLLDSQEIDITDFFDGAGNLIAHQFERIKLNPGSKIRLNLDGDKKVFPLTERICRTQETLMITIKNLHQFQQEGAFESRVGKSIGSCYEMHNTI